METVKAFKCELYSLNEYRPPISKTKMAKITKMALKAKKFYKHVVQSVEKFIQKCKPDHKVPGLYVIDSIVRKSRHQFGQEKDMFGPRFSRNITATFQDLQRCPSADKSKILKVLALWQKNAVFSSDIMQPLLDLVAGWSSPPVSDASAITSSSMDPADASSLCQIAGAPPTASTGPADAEQSYPGQALLMNSAETINFVRHVLESPEGQQLVRNLQLQQKRNPQCSLLQSLDAGLVVQLQALSSKLMVGTDPRVPSTPEWGPSSVSRLMLETTEGSGKQDAGKGSSQPQTILEPIAMCQSPSSAEKRDLDHKQNHQPPETSSGVAVPSEITIHQEPVEADGRMFCKQLNQDPCEDDSTMERKTMESKNEAAGNMRQPSGLWSRLRSRSPRKRGSRSLSGSCKCELRDWSTSSPGECSRTSSCSCSSEQCTYGRESGQRQKELPPVRPRTLSVCSSTLRVRRLGGLLTEEDVASLCEEFGPIESIQIIAPGDCAHVCMVHRADAHRALQELRMRSHEIGSPAVAVSWALNRGVKLEYHHQWDEDLGVTYIPWGSVNQHDLARLAQGGAIDGETVDSDCEMVLQMASSWGPEGHAPVILEPGAHSNAQAISPGEPVAEAPMQAPPLPDSGLPRLSCAAPKTFQELPSASAVPPVASGPPSKLSSTLEISQNSVDMVTTDSAVYGAGTSYSCLDTDPQAAVEPNGATQGTPQGVPASTQYSVGLLGSCPSVFLQQTNMGLLKVPRAQRMVGPPGVTRWPLLPPELHVPSPAPLSVPRGSRRPTCWPGTRPASPDIVPIDSTIWGHRLPNCRARIMAPANLHSRSPFLADWRKHWPGPPRGNLEMLEMGGSPWVGPRGFQSCRPHPYCYIPKWSEDGTRGGRRGGGGRWPARGLVGRQLGPDNCLPRTGSEGDDNSESL
ncbi:SR-related and CTD-associated factor 8-like isoform X2 [Brienomyrus brachyistius]|uniref:SR-related and CTD-associated factor 8-like isoform X2 n=1 Tax=Brienomyrus brachyistius TaxID=42636 RepID=UPI0020B2C357|nr:SR-related and CTD-associated factor 8-like isoform X2 [Brienomyrus brachyistius]